MLLVFVHVKGCIAMPVFCFPISRKNFSFSFTAIMTLDWSRHVILIRSRDAVSDDEGSPVAASETMLR